MLELRDLFLVHNLSVTLMQTKTKVVTQRSLTTAFTFGLEDDTGPKLDSFFFLPTRKPTEIQWRFTEAGERVRVSTRSGRIIPKPEFPRADGIVPETWTGKLMGRKKLGM